jgi:hypothetical protein
MGSAPIGPKWLSIVRDKHQRWALHPGKKCYRLLESSELQADREGVGMNVPSVSSHRPAMIRGEGRVESESPAHLRNLQQALQQDDQDVMLSPLAGS